jgi:hypothetical protein
VKETEDTLRVHGWQAAVACTSAFHTQSPSRPGHTDIVHPLKKHMVLDAITRARKIEALSPGAALGLTCFI